MSDDKKTGDVMTEGATNEIYAELGSMNAEIQGLGRSFDHYATESNRRFDNAQADNNRRFSVVEEKVNQPFPVWQMFGAMTAFAVVVGSLVSFALNPLYGDIEQLQSSVRALNSIVNKEIDALREEIDNEVDSTRDKINDRVDDEIDATRAELQAALLRINELEEQVATSHGTHEGVKVVQGIHDRSIQRLESIIFSGDRQ